MRRKKPRITLFAGVAEKWEASNYNQHWVAQLGENQVHEGNQELRLT